MRPHAILFRPAIAGNLGCIYRSCFGFGASLHVIGPLPFDLSDKSLHRGAGNRLEPSLRSAAAAGDPEPAAGTSTIPLEVASATISHNNGPPFIFYSDVEDFCERGLGRFDFIGTLTKFSSRSIHHLGNDLSDFNQRQGRTDAMIDAAVLLGNESHGLTKLPVELHSLLHGSDKAAGGHRKPLCMPYHLPMHPAARSYNLAVSAGIGLYELTRPVTP